MLEDVQARIASFNPRTPEEFSALIARRDMHDFLMARLAKLPQADAINITDSNGVMRASTRVFPSPVIDLSDRDTYRHLSTTPDSQVFIGEPVFSKLTGVWSMFFARRIESADGVFLGVALIGLQPSKFMSLYNAIGAIPGASSLLLRRDGTIYLRHPDAVERAGDKLPESLAWYDVVKDGGGYFRSTGVFDTESRWVAVRPVEQYPLVVNVAISEDIALAVWRSRAAMIAFGTLLAIAVMTALLRLIVVGYRKTLASEALLIERETLLATQANELTLANMRFGTALAHMRQALAMFDANDCIVIHNKGYADLYGLSSEQMPPGTSLERILELRVANGMYSKDGPEAYLRQHRNHFHGKTSHVEQMHDGRFILVTLQKMPDGGWVTTHEDISDRERVVAQISHMAHHDPLTDLANRSLFLEHLEALGRRADVGANYAVMLVDLDHFKAINDTYGHLAGDALLWTVANRMRETVGVNGLIARLGGDEFAIALDVRQSDDRSDILHLATQLLEAVEKPYFIENKQLRVGVSIGVAFCDNQSRTLTEIMKHADTALYRAKAEGRNCWRLYSLAMENEVVTRSQMAQELDAAISDDQLEVHYQPIVETGGLGVRVMEALARWRHPTRGLVPPVEFICLAEESGLIHKLGAWVLEQACRDAAIWPDTVKVAVNVSSLQLASGNLVGDVQRALTLSGISPARLELEITESVELADNVQNLGILHGLREIGVSIVLDDFGAGYSSLNYLNRFPFDKIKIDRSFIQGLGVHASSSAIVLATTSIARALGAQTVAEGIETELQSEMLRAADVSQMQGYLFGKPRPASEWRFVDGHAVTLDTSAGQNRAA